MAKKSFTEKSFKIIVFFCASITIIVVLAIIIFLFYKGLPLFKTVSVWDFLFSTHWNPTSSHPHYGIASFLVSSFYVTGLSLIWSVPIGVIIGIYMCELLPKNLFSVANSITEILAGIPSVVVGFIGVVVMAPLLRHVFFFIPNNSGFSILNASLVLGFMILPTIIQMTIGAFQSIPKSFYYASLALGATRFQTIYRVLLPSIRDVLMVSIILAIGRALGETIGVLMVAGNRYIMPTSIFDPARTLTMNIISDIGYASGDHLKALFSTALVLFIFIFILNFTVYTVFNRLLAKSKLKG